MFKWPQTNEDRTLARAIAESIATASGNGDDEVVVTIRVHVAAYNER